jgi:2,5-dioxopentanoate dehydrogenase
MKPDGGSLIGFGSSGGSGAAFKAFDPANRTELEPSFISALPEDVDRAVGLAAAAAPVLTRLTGAQRRRFLQTIAANLEAKADDLVRRAQQETALAERRLRGELARTAHQLRLYGEAAEQGWWADARIETADPARRPTPRPDHRSMLRPLGPVVVFGSSNFPFAYSVAGTASALAAGCPVIVKAHPAHPGTSELVGRLILHAVRDCGLPEGTFSLLFDAGFGVGQALVRHPLVKAVGFTGSLKGGRALTDLAASRPEPIPVYAEMGSINPVFILPGALAERADEITAGLLASATQEVGQLCTNPGLIVMIRTPEAQTFLQGLISRLRATPAAPMLTPGMAKTFAALTTARSRQAGVKSLVAGEAGEGCAAPHWFETEALGFLGSPALSEEIFGPSALVVWCRDRAQLLEVAAHLEGSLAVAVHAGATETAAQADLVEVLATRAGRVVFNGYPTGVEVSHAIVHGGPYPSTSDGGRSTSVGTRALQRWGRLVCYQNSPPMLLPPELQDANPLGLLRLVDGRFTDAKL